MLSNPTRPGSDQRDLTDQRLTVQSEVASKSEPTALAEVTVRLVLVWGYGVWDLSNRLPGQSLMEFLVAQESGVIAESWWAGLAGERQTAASLAKLRSEYKVVHSIPVPG